MSDSDIENEDMLTFRTEIGAISVGGFSKNPKSTISSLKNNDTVSSQQMDLPQQNVRRMYGGRELSPLSFRRGFDQRDFGTVQYANSHRSLVDWEARRSRSRRSSSLCCSVDSTVTVIDMKNALKYDDTINTHELRDIIEIASQALKRKTRRRFEQKRKKTLLHKSSKSKTIRILKTICDSDEDNNESTSSDDEQNSLKNDTVLGQQKNGINKSLLMSSTNKNCHYMDQSMAVKKNVFSIMPKTGDKVSDIMRPDSIETCNKEQTLKDIFTEEYMFPSQRFNQKKTETKINDSNRFKSKTTESRTNHSSEDEEIFSTYKNRKRGHSNNIGNNAKRIKAAVTQTEENKMLPDKDTFNETFKIPFMPQPILNSKNNATKENVISKLVQPVNSINNDSQKEDGNKENQPEVFMKSNYMKRKLFTQTADLLSCSLGDSAGPSPQRKVDNKKNKVKKLVPTQSCVYRDISEEGDSVFDFINKLMTSEKVNATSSKTMSPCDNTIDSDVNDTFTDETLNCRDLDIYSKQACIAKGNNDASSPSFHPTDCNFVSLHNVTSQNVRNHSKNESSLHNEISQNIGDPSKNISQKSKYIKMFWDTDIESEMESENIPVWKIAKPTEFKDHLTEVTSTALNTHQGEGIGKILTVQSLKNKKLNTINKIEKVNEKKGTIKNSTQNKDNIVTQEDENTNKKKDGRQQESSLELITDEENASRSRTIRNRRGNNFNNSCSRCKNAANEPKKSKGNKIQKNRNETSKENISELSDNDINITINCLRPRKANKINSKKNNRDETSKENISEHSDSDINITINSLRPRKANKISSKKKNRDETSKENISEHSDSDINITINSLRQRKANKISSKKKKLRRDFKGKYFRT